MTIIPLVWLMPAYLTAEKFCRVNGSEQCFILQKLRRLNLDKTEMLQSLIRHPFSAFVALLKQDSVNGPVVEQNKFNITIA